MAAALASGWCSTLKVTLRGDGTKKGFRIVADNGNGGRIGNGFPSFLPKEIENVKDPFARSFALRIQRLPVQMGVQKYCIMSSCVKAHARRETSPVVLLHSFDSSCLEWRFAYPLLEEAGLEAWAIDVLGWGFSDLGRLPPCNAPSKRYHLYQFWKSHVKRPMVLVGPSLGAAVAIDFAVNFPEAVEKLILISPSVYAEGIGNLSRLPKIVAYAGVSLLKSIPLRLYANLMTFNNISFSTHLDWTNVGRLHCLLPWWEDATVDFIMSGGYNVVSQIRQVKHRALVVLGDDDQIISNKISSRLQSDLQNATLRWIPEGGHLPHIEKFDFVAKLIADYAAEKETSSQEQRRPGTKGDTQGLPLGSSPYLNHNNTEDYKRNAYGTQGHQEPKSTSRGTGATTGPTLAGSNLSKGEAAVIGGTNRSSIP
ncbi:Serine aminopeptidase, S33 [Dillenia turbinata]|uniref:Serine aminopeptidase, S33 n=1 Tax=Dillenia turbinata TaxID=194707 RepID=A0AAN8VDS6_9MAGN